MIKILVITPYAHDANSYWRCMGPLSYLDRQSDGEIKVTLAETEKGVSWMHVMQHDIVFLHRPCRNDDLIVMQIAHNLNIPVWVDYDDWLFDLPGWNPHKGIYDNPGLQQIMAQCISCADQVTVSTQALCDKFRLINPNVSVLPNAYRSDIFRSYREEELPERNNIAVWRGTNTHDGDLLSVKEGFHALSHKTVFMGGPSWMLLSGMSSDQYEIKAPCDVILYHQMIWQMRPKVFVFPLVDCFFNQCKSNIAYIEAIHAGAVVVAPCMPEWVKPGVITYTAHDSQSFHDAVEAAFEISEKDHQEIMKLGFEVMKENYDIRVINPMRAHVVNQILERSYFQKNKNNPFNQGVGLNALALLKNTRVESYL